MCRGTFYSLLHLPTKPEHFCTAAVCGAARRASVMKRIEPPWTAQLVVSWFGLQLLIEAVGLGVDAPACEKLVLGRACVRVFVCVYDNAFGVFQAAVNASGEQGGVGATGVRHNGWPVTNGPWASPRLLMSLLARHHQPSIHVPACAFLRMFLFA
ncbi:hypothetical protein PLESTM_000281900 [Pleodorina starrii]|nr:hypothetical protein PLESTM_000281900 [Pleodorina starrii]